MLHCYKSKADAAESSNKNRIHLQKSQLQRVTDSDSLQISVRSKSGVELQIYRTVRWAFVVCRQLAHSEFAFIFAAGADFKVLEDFSAFDKVFLASFQQLLPLHKKSWKWMKKAAKKIRAKVFLICENLLFICGVKHTQRMCSSELP